MSPSTTTVSAAASSAGPLLRWAGAAAALFYGVSSGSMSFINKLVLSSFGFTYPYFLILSQMVFTATVFRFLHAAGYVSLPAITFANLRLCWQPAILNLFHSVLSLHALSGMNVAMYTILKRCVPLVSLFLLPCLLQMGLPSLPVVGSVLLMTAGCVFTGLGDLSFDFTSYTFGILSVFSQALYLTLAQRVGLQNNTMSAASIAYLNSLNCVPPMIFATAVSSEITKVLQFPHLNTPEFLLSFFVVISMGCLLNYSVFLCTTLNSALTTSVVGVVKSVVVVIVGLFTFGGVHITPLGAGGICLNTIGSGWYAYAKYQEKSVVAETSRATHSLVTSNMSNGSCVSDTYCNAEKESSEFSRINQV